MRKRGRHGSIEKAWRSVGQGAVQRLTVQYPVHFFRAVSSRLAHMIAKSVLPGRSLASPLAALNAGQEKAEKRHGCNDYDCDGVLIHRISLVKSKSKPNQCCCRPGLNVRKAVARINSVPRGPLAQPSH